MASLGEERFPAELRRWVSNQGYHLGKLLGVGLLAHSTFVFSSFFDSGFVVHSVSLLKPERMNQVVKTRLALLAEFTEEAVSPQLPALWP